MSFSVEILKDGNISYDWKTLYVGFKLNFISKDDIAKSAIEYLVNNPQSHNENVIQLASGENNVDYEELLINVLHGLKIDDLSPGSNVWELEKRKWRYCILIFIKDKYQNDLEELLVKVAEAYADMGYPEDMEIFIYYQPSKDGYNSSLYSHEENVNRLVDLFNDFLKKEKLYLDKKIT